MTSTPLIQDFSLPGEICRKFALDWSAENKIAICTSKTIYILQSYCSPCEVGFPTPLHKQVIRVPDIPMQLNPITIPSNPYKFIENHEDKDNLFNVLMDHTLNPTPPERADTFRSFRCCRWSPKGASTASRCLLAALTMDHRLVLYEENDKEWRSLCDLTELLKEQLLRDKAQAREEKRDSKVKKKKKKKKIGRPKKDKDEEDHDDEEYDPSEEEYETGRRSIFNISKVLNYEELVEETYRMAPVEITWTGMFGSPPSSGGDAGSEFCFLIVAMKSGLIQFWKVSPGDRKIVSLVHEWDTGLGMLTAMSWQQTSSIAGFLIVGSWKGILAFLSIGIQISDQEPTVTVKSMCKVWDEEDSVAVDHIAILKIALRKYVMISAKLHALVGCEIALTEDSIIIRNIGHSFGLHRLPVTGMTVMDTRTIPQYRVLISTMEGQLIEIKVSLGTDEIKFQHEKIPIDLDLKNNAIQGLAISSNGLLCSAILSTSVYFDHLQKKENLQFAMFATRPSDEIYSKLRGVLKPQFSFLPSAAHTVAHHSDYLDWLRAELASGNPLPQWIIEFFLQMDHLENRSELELYFMRFLLHAHVSGLAVNSRIKGKLDVRLYIVESMIMRNHISKIFSKIQDNMDVLTPTQSQSLLLMADWLLKEYQMPVGQLYSAMGVDVPNDPADLPARENCGICKGPVAIENIKVGMCAKGHQLPRCCQSLLMCDVVPYVTCTSCKSVALKGVWISSMVCTLCGMTMVE